MLPTYALFVAIDARDCARHASGISCNSSVAFVTSDCNTGRERDGLTKEARQDSRLSETVCRQRTAELASLAQHDYASLATMRPMPTRDHPSGNWHPVRVVLVDD
jgi:hypothetical protein